MNIDQHTHPDKLERYSFIWSEVRLIVAAIALLLGGIPPVLFLLPSMPIVVLFLKLAWIISGVATGYLLYRWYTGGQKVFGDSEMKDTAAFFVSVVSGLNLGIVGLLGTNIGMSLSSNKLVFVVVAVVYIIAAWHLYQRWSARGQKVF